MMQEGGAETEQQSGRGFFTSVVLTVNMVMGAGVVGLPYAFFHAGPKP
jgi:amino acid permease